MNVREWALPVYTVLTELAVGSLFILWVVRTFCAYRFGQRKYDQVIENTLLVMTFTIATGILGAHFHLSKPYLSFLAFLNIRSSWLSREVLVNSLFLVSAVALIYVQWRKPEQQTLKTILGWVMVLFGLATVYSMARIYMLPTQGAWNSPFTMVSFYSTALLLGFVALPSLMVIDLKYSELRDSVKARQQEIVIPLLLPWFAGGAVIVMGVLIAENIQQLIFLGNSTDQTALVSIMLLSRLYPILFQLRLTLIVIGVALLLLAAFWLRQGRISVYNLMVPCYISCLLVLIGEILGRFLFYATHIRIGI